MTTTTSPITLRLAWAQSLFEHRDYAAAARALADLVDEAAADRDEVLHGTTDLRLLLARAYYHSAQLGRAEQTLRTVVEEAPTDGYAHLLLGRTLQRAGRHDEAQRSLALAEVLADYERPSTYGGTTRTDA